MIFNEVKLGYEEFRVICVLRIFDDNFMSFLVWYLKF